ncbi:Uncharacterised protein [BD1-7 clade bacterium]|uniref:Uncharacterized protein n=1 Tax=BD1-7 clade bacterium TaxID=2029982 RepID=A0A5S9NMC8_9GAMM|nr:Uncharacterised protein [BD1-7 clade bacterium]CAA0094204.1 Uncharacterised protein [BD1-7 clade bacterium]
MGNNIDHNRDVDAPDSQAININELDKTTAEAKRDIRNRIETREMARELGLTGEDLAIFCDISSQKQ